MVNLDIIFDELQKIADNTSKTPAERDIARNKIYILRYQIMKKII
jgi:hypothetical protein